MAFLLTALAAYLLGSIPTGYLVARWKNIDITQVGSGNIGATNVFRILGRGPGIFVLLTDAAKGALSVLFLPGLAALVAGVGSPWLAALAAVCAVLGHNFTCWLRFKGGKGIATSAGALAALVPAAFLVIFITWIVVFALGRYVSLASIAAAAVLPFATAFTIQGELRWPLVGLTLLLAFLAIWRHRPNIRRLLDGTENRFGPKKEVAS
jgi:acyl phosphate:glycerol-3-phosphate acyltransferase